jgi:hypothetical protein
MIAWFKNSTDGNQDFSSHARKSAEILRESAMLALSSSSSSSSLSTGPTQTSFVIEWLFLSGLIPLNAFPHDLDKALISNQILTSTFSVSDRLHALALVICNMTGVDVDPADSSLDQLQESKEEITPTKSPCRPRQEILVVVDGQNVAKQHHGRPSKRDRYSAEGIKIVCDFFMARGFKVKVFVPQFWLDERRLPADSGIEIDKDAPQPFPASSGFAESYAILCDLQARNMIAKTPSKDYDDSYVIAYAQQKNALVVSNDMYRDWVKKRKSDVWKLIGPKAQVEKAAEIVGATEDAWIKSHVLSYTFIDDDFLPNPDFDFSVIEKESQTNNQNSE